MEPLKHECGVAMIRLLKPLSYYKEKYGTASYALNKLYLLMEKQHNRGQEGAGIACTNLDARPGEEYMFRERALGSGAITEIFANIDADQWSEASILMGHLRYSTTGKSGLAHVHPFMRRNNWRAKNLCLCGNFNLTNVDEVFDEITAKGQHPRIYNDTYIMLEMMGHRLDRESERIYNIAKLQGLEGTDLTTYIEDNIDITNILRTTTPLFDGGYVLCGFTGSGEMFSMRDPWAIRPAFWYRDDEVLVVASERPVIQTTFDLPTDSIHELLPGQALTVRKNGNVALTQILQPRGNHACSFERIYFSRGSDRDIYRERKALGEQLTPQIDKAIGGDLEHTVFSYVPNTAEVAFYGMLDGFKKQLNEQKVEQLYRLTQQHNPSREELRAILHNYIRSEKVAIKDIKLRTFITEGNQRNDLAAHVYDITYGSLEPQVDNLVIIDDSIVRGTTLRESIIRILDRLHPKKMVLVSSCPQVRYPDYYGIDMSHLDEFIAFRAAVALHIDRGSWQTLHDIYRRCIEQQSLPAEQMKNYVKEIYSFTTDEISDKMLDLLRPEDVTTPIQLVFQSLEGLHRACPHHPGDWYFSGDYPTPGGVRLVNQAYIDWFEKIENGQISNK
ncbi:MAG: amidophosphoribosyltransferase [Bacteroidaceae bacterium]|nr:amidophosphoribosyltransferase [Bacteroidaceae bacterium]